MDTIRVQRGGVIRTYTLLERLGSGSFSQVYKCRTVVDGKEEIYAVKVFNKSFLKNEKTWKRVSGGMECHTAFEKVELEIALMKKLNHPNLVKLIDVVDDEQLDRLYMIIEYVERGQIMVCNEQTMEFTSPITHKVLTEDKARRYLFDIMSGLKYLHLHKVVHRDIKPENLLVSNEDHVKIVDFGVAHLFETCNNVEQELRDQLPVTTKPLNLLTRTHTGLLRNTAGTIYFYAPECTTDQPYNTYAVDIWAVGVTLYIMVVGKLPLYNPDLVSFFDELVEKEIVYPSSLSPELIDLLQRFLCRDPLKRISIDEVLEHPWMKKACFAADDHIITIRRDLLSNEEISDALVQRYRNDSSVTPPEDDMEPGEEEEQEQEDGNEKKRKAVQVVMNQIRSTKCCVL